MAIIAEDKFVNGINVKGWREKITYDVHGNPTYIMYIHPEDEMEKMLNNILDETQEREDFIRMNKGLPLD